MEKIFANMVEWQTRKFEGLVGVSRAGSNPVICTKNQTERSFFVSGDLCGKAHNTFFKRKPTIIVLYPAIDDRMQKMAAAQYFQGVDSHFVVRRMGPT